MPRVAYWTGRKRPPFSAEWKRNMGDSRRGSHPTPQTRKKIGDAQRGEVSRNWRGDEVGYSGLHTWLRKNHGRATRCERADETCSKKMFDWANVSGGYARDINDFMQLCRSHHVRMDKNWLKELRNK